VRLPANSSFDKPTWYVVIILAAICVPLYLSTSNYLLAGVLERAPSSAEILARVAANARNQPVGYTSVREYRLRNVRFDKEATVVARVTYQPNQGKEFVVLGSQGSPKLAEIVEKLLVSEVEASKPSHLTDHEIGPSNYTASMRRTETIAGRSCYVVDLVPRHKSKFLIRGTAWIDRKNYAVLRLEGATATRISMWVGAAHIQQEFGEVDGVWLPTHTGAIASSLLLGACELDITYKNYLVRDLDRQAPIGAADLNPPRP
jgi:hypothetical protein